mgnify:FL=1
MSKLISGKEALIALANGEEVECRAYEKNWINANNKHHPLSLFFDDSFQFRLKPRTITINGIEVPASFNGQLAHKQYAYVLSTAHPKGYDGIKFYDGNVQPLFCWTDEDEIKQVVSALRSVFKPQ